MNIFATSHCPRKSAEALDDRLLFKMHIETSQLLCTTVRRYLGKSKTCKGIKRGWDDSQETVIFTQGRSRNVQAFKTVWIIPEIGEYIDKKGIAHLELYMNINNPSHPCADWASKTLGNFNWLVDHGKALCDIHEEINPQVELTDRYMLNSCEKLRDKIPLTSWRAWDVGKPTSVVYDRKPFVDCSMFQNHARIINTEEKYRRTLILKWREWRKEYRNGNSRYYPKWSGTRGKPDWFSY